MECPYCTETYRKRVPLFNETNNRMIMTEINVWYLYHTVNDITTVITIHYCPMCGRKLVVPYKHMTTINAKGTGEF